MATRGLDREYQAAARRTARADAVEPRAKSARYDKRSRRIVVDLRNGARFMFPPELAQGLAGADDRALSNINISPSGAGLSWPDLDADFNLPSLMAGIFGTREWMRRINRKRRAG
jgi:hypothetical protein